MSDGIFLFPQPAQMSSKDSSLVWIAVNEDGVSILDHSTMVGKNEGWLTLPSPNSTFSSPLWTQRAELRDHVSQPTLPKPCFPLG